jgi:hypothetical protein
MSSVGKSDPVTCFVVMLFGGNWDEYYTEVYAPAISDAGLIAVRADEVFRAGSILQDIVNLLTSCQVVLADITEANRNVHYELGLAHALGKPTVLVAPREMNVFFDVGQERIVTYSKESPFWGRDLRASIAQAVRDTASHPASAIPTAFMHIKPNRLAVDEDSLRIRRIEDLLTDLMRLIPSGSAGPMSRLTSVLQGLPQAEREAEQRLAYASRDEVIRDLVSGGYGRYMAETAVANAAARTGK